MPEEHLFLHQWNISLCIGERPSGCITPKQMHGNIIVPVSSCVSQVTIADGLIGSINDKPFGIYTADCIPLVLTTPTRAFALHISRHSSIAGILQETTVQLGKEKITGAYIGPHICETCFAFETVGERIGQFMTQYPYAVTHRKRTTHLSMQKVVEQYLKNLSVLPATIIVDTRCTYEDTSLPSYKRWLMEGKKGELLRITTTVQGVH